MPIDPRIALGYQPPQFEQPMNLMANAMKLQSMQQENALAQRQAAQLERQQMQQNRLGLLLARGASPEMLQREGFFEPAEQVLNLQTTRASERSAAATAEAAAKEKEMARRKAMFGVLAVAKDPAKYAAARDIAQGMGFDLTGIPEQFPGTDYITALEDSLLTPAERAERAAKARTAAIQEGQLAVSQGNLSLSREELAFRRQKEAREAAAPVKGREPPSGYEYAPDGSLRPIKGGPADPEAIAAREAASKGEGAGKTTEQERRDSYNARRLLSSLRSIKSAIIKDPGATAPGVLEAAALSSPFGILEPAANLVRGNQRQIVAAAQADVIDTLLYLATGAAYNKEQLEAQRQSYMVNFTDREAVREDKRQRLEDLVQAAKIRAGNAWTPELEAELSTIIPAKTGASAAATAPPTDVSAEDWKFMTPEERALWQKQR